MNPTNLTDKQLHDGAHSKYVYDPLTGLFTWKHTKNNHVAGEPAGAITSGGYLRIYLKSCTYNDAVVAYLMQTGEYHKYMGRHDKDVNNCEFANLYPSDKMTVNNVTFNKISKVGLVEYLDANPLPVGRLAVELKTSPHTIQRNLVELVLDGYLTCNRRRVFTLTAKGHKEVFIKGDFNTTTRRDIYVLFQLALPGTLTGDKGPKVMHYKRGNYE